MTASAEIFEQHYRTYRAQMVGIDFDAIQERLGLLRDGDGFRLPFFNTEYRVSTDGIADAQGRRPDYMAFVILAKYILLCPEQPHLDAQWVSFKDFKKDAQFTNVNYFASDTERALEKQFAGRLPDLVNAGRAVGGVREKMDLPYDLCMQFTALPRLSLLLLFNDRDDEFPATCKVLFQKHAEYYLDPESLAMTGACLVKHLKKAFLHS